MKQRGAINAWRCDRCQQFTVAVHVDAGVTPMFLGCRADLICRGRATSLGYPPAIPKTLLLKIRWEWYKPQGKELRKMSMEMQQHVAAGGLAIRPLTDEGKKAFL